MFAQRPRIHAEGAVQSSCVCSRRASCEARFVKQSTGVSSTVTGESKRQLLPSCPGLIRFHLGYSLKLLNQLKPRKWKVVKLGTITPAGIGWCNSGDVKCQPLHSKHDRLLLRRGADVYSYAPDEDKMVKEFVLLSQRLERSTRCSPDTFVCHMSL